MPEGVGKVFRDRFGKRVAALRKAKGLTQEGLARIAEMPTGVISKVEQGAVFPRDLTLQRIAEALEVSPQELFGIPESEEAS